MTGSPYVVDRETVRNQFFVRIVNKRADPATFKLELAATPAGTRRTGFEQPVSVGPLGEIVHPLILQQPRAGYSGPFHFKVRVLGDDGRYTLEREVEFLGPDARLLREEEAAHAGR